MTIQTQSEQSCAKKSQRERLAGHIVVRQREQIPGVWDSHNASGEKTVVVDCRNATAEIKRIILAPQPLITRTRLSAAGLPHQNRSHRPPAPGFLLLQLLLQCMKVRMAEHNIFPLAGRLQNIPLRYPRGRFSSLP